jgi:hypothetical protein
VFVYPKNACMASCSVRFRAGFMARRCSIYMRLFFFIPFSSSQVSLKILQSGFWKNLAKDRAVTKRMFFISGDSDDNGGNALWFSGSGAAKGGYFFGKGFPRRRWPANIKVGIGRFAGLVAIIMARESGLPSIWRVRKELVPGERVIGIYKSSVSWFGGACSFSFSIVHFRYIDFEYLVSRVVAGVVVKGSLKTGKS